MRWKYLQQKFNLRSPNRITDFCFCAITSVGTKLLWETNIQSENFERELWNENPRKQQSNVIERDQVYREAWTGLMYAQIYELKIDFSL